MKVRVQQNKYESILAFPLLLLLLTVCFAELLCWKYAKEWRAEVNPMHNGLLQSVEDKDPHTPSGPQVIISILS